MYKHSRIALFALVAVILIGSLTQTTPASASDVDLGSPSSIDELLASPEYMAEHADVARLYQAFFNRTPDLEGLVYWINVYEDGYRLIDLAAFFSVSQEFLITYGVLGTDAEFLEVVYTNVLGRSYDQDGFDYWIQQMEAGLPRPDTVFWIVSGTEFATEYPFAPTSPDATSALLTSADVDAGYSLHSSHRSTALATDFERLVPCARYRQIHTNAFFTAHERPDDTASVFQGVYAFSTENAAREVLANHRQLTVECVMESYEFDNGTVFLSSHTSADSSLQERIGDETVVVEVEWKWPTTGAAPAPVSHFYLFVVRDANVVTITDVTRRTSLADFAEGERYASLTSERMRVLLGLG